MISSTLSHKYEVLMRFLGSYITGCSYRSSGSLKTCMKDCSYNLQHQSVRSFSPRFIDDVHLKTRHVRSFF